MKLKDQTKEIGLQQTNSLFQIWINLKDSIFNVLFVLLDNNNEEQSVMGLLFEVGIDYLQMMAFPFNSSVIEVWNGGTTLDNLTSIMNTLSIDTFLPSVSIETFLIMVYALIFAIILVIIDIIYVGYSFSKKKFKFTWPLVLLAKIVPIFVTVFFLPIMQTLYSVVTCEIAPQMPGVQVMTSFPDIVCWEGWHLFHAVVTLIFSTLFVFIACLVALAIFEPRMTTNRLTARQNSTGFTPFQGTWIYCVLLFSLSGWLYWTYNVNDPYYNKTASKFFRIMSTYYFWTNFMLLVSQILYSLQFQGGLIVWICGIIFIALIILFEKKSNIDKLFSSNLKFRSGEQLESHIKYVLLLIHNKKSDKNSYMLLLGYIQKHKDICTEDDCPLKVPKKNTFNYHQSSANVQSLTQKTPKTTQNLKSKVKKTQEYVDIELQENCNRLVKQLQRMYREGIKKYPKCTKLRLSFAFFYMQKLNNKAKAYEQFAIALNTEPSFGQEFIIYRFRKIIREKLEQKDKDDDSQLIDIIRLDNHISLCEEAMILSAKLHRQFWSELQQQTPDLKKLNDIGSKITSTISNVSSNYKQVAKINQCIVQITYNYGIYLVLIQQEMQKGAQLIAKAKIKYKEKVDIEDIKRKKEFIFDDENIDSCLYPILVVSAGSEQTGQIIIANSLFSQLTGFYKEQLLQRNIDKLLPEIYIGYHNNFIKRWLSGQSHSKDYMNSIHQGFLKHKSGFIIRATYKIRYDMNEKQEFIISFKPIKSQKYKSVIITDRCGNIKQVSAQIYFLLGLDRQIVQKQAQSIESYFKFPQISEDEKRDPNLSFQAVIQVQGLQQFVHVQRQQVRIKTFQAGLSKTKTGLQIINEYQTEIYANGTQRIGYVYFITKAISLGAQANMQAHQNILNQPLFLQQMVDQLQYGKFYNSDGYELQLQSISNKQQAFQFNKFGVDIKVTRLLPNGDFKKVYYDQQDQSDYDFQETIEDQKQLLKVKKLTSLEYQQKIKESINTDITLRQINNIKWGSLGFLLIVNCIIVYSIFSVVLQFQYQKQQIEIILNQIEQFDFVSKGVTKTFQILPQAQAIVFHEVLKKHMIKQQPSLLVNYTSFNTNTKQKNLTNFMMHLNGLLIQFYNSKGIYETVQTIYENYLNLYLALETFRKQNTVVQKSSNFILKGIIFIFGQLFISLFFIALWIYQVLKMGQIRTNIMIWFLQIPIYYVKFINNNCNKFMKNYVQVKQLEVKGLQLGDKDQCFDEYDDYIQEQQFQEQKKIRKTLIARYNKKNILSKLDVSYAKFFWLAVYSCIFTTIFIFLASKTQDVYVFLKPQIQFTGDQLRWNYALLIGLNIQNRTLSINERNISAINQQIKSNFKNYLRSPQMKDFNHQILDFQAKQISRLYQQTFFKSLCNNQNETQKFSCANSFNGILKGGYLTYSTSLQKITTAQILQLKQVQQKYINPALLNLVQQQKKFLQAEITSTISSGIIILYIFSATTFLGFLVPWILYLKAENTSIVRTIKMLNMIPLFLIPRARKQTRQFIQWIIKQANKEKHKK